MKNKTPKREEPRLQQKRCEFDFHEDLTISELVSWAAGHDLDPATVIIRACGEGYDDANLQASFVRTETEEEYEVRVEEARRKAQREAEERDRRRAEDQRNNEIRKLEAQIKKLKGL